MRSTASSAAPSPTRRALHERTPSDTNNKASSSSLRLVTDKEDSSAPSTNPYPTKPERVISPSSDREDSTVPVKDIPDVSSEARSSATVEKSIADLWDLPYFFGAENKASQIWGRSSRSSYPEPISPEQGSSRPNENSENSDDDDIAVLPTDAPTIKTVVSNPPSEPQSPESSSPGPSRLQGATMGDSSPNVVPIGPPSSPNFVAFDSSSLDFAPIGNSSSNSGSASRSNSVKSLNSMGTVVRHVGATPWIHSSTPEYSSSHSRSRSQSFRSSPPVASIKSGSLVSRSGHSRSGSGTGSGSGSGAFSSRSAVSGSDIQPNHDSGVFIQYPILRGPPSTSSRAEMSRPAITGSSAEGSMANGSLGLRNHSLTTVSSQRSAECSSNVAASAGASADNTVEEISRPPAALSRQKSSSSLWFATNPQKDEHLDFLATLPPALTRPGNPAVPSSLSSRSRSSSLQSSKRPGTGSSHILNVAPAWARAYYQSDGQAINYALSLIEGSRPSSARSNASNAIAYLPTALSRPRTRHQEITQDLSQRKASDPRDPRSHWVLGPELENGSRPTTSRSQIRGSWSPHLFPDRHVVQHKARAWDAVSMHSFAEPTFGRRNIQVYSFCLGFIFPFAWMVAAFLPLPPPAEVQERKSGPDLERTLKMRTYDVDQRRHENARWWRNLNRFMVPLGVVIVILIVILAVVGTTVGF